MDSYLDFLTKPIIPLDQRPKGCATCPFGGIKVGSRGPEDSPFVIVGESPGGSEIARGYPFVGPSGEMLEDTLKQVGWREGIDPEPYILNALQCLPRNKDQPGVMANAAKCCQGRLATELEKYPRKVILALGAAASWSLTNNFGIKVTMDRGKLYKHPAAEVGVVSTVHPAYILRNGSAFITWKRDLQYAIDLLQGRDPKAGLWAPPMWNVLKTREELEALVSRQSRATHIAADIETGGSRGAGLHFQRGYILMLGLTSNLSNGNMVDIIPGDLIWENEDLMHQLLGNKAKWIWQNGKFDVKFFRHEGIQEARVDEDTMLLSYTLNENKGHDLDTIAWDWIGAPKHKNMIDDWFHANRIARKNWDYGLIPKEMLYQYAAYDISKTYKMFWPLKEAVETDPHSSKEYNDLLIPGSEFLVQVEMKGLKLDPIRVKENDDYILGLQQEADAAIQEWAIKYTGHQINIGSPQQLSDLLYNRMKLGPIGGSTDEDHLIKIQRRFDHPIVPLLMRWRKHAKARNTYVKSVYGTVDKKGRPDKMPWAGTDGRVHVSFKLHGTTTGRLASSDPTNVQNWPRDARIRGQVVAEDGHVLVEVDLNQAELRCLALMSGDPTLMAIYTANEVSIHHITSVAMFGENYTSDEKMRAKAVNFGIVYGRTGPSLAEEFNISLAEANEYIKVWLARYPVAAKFIEGCREAPHKQRTLITNFGRRKRWGAVSFENARNLENEAANFPHQSTAHDITLRAGIETQPVIRRVWNAHYVNEIHDALYFEIADDPMIYGPAVAYVQSVMSRVPRDYGLTKVPFLAEAKVGWRWGAEKNAKELGEKDPAKLAEYMRDFSPTEEHQELARRLITA